MRADERGAFEEFFERFAPVLREEAVRLRIQPALRDEAVVECLEESAMSLTRRDAMTPTSLAGYLIVSIRRKHLNRLRSEKRRERRERDAVDWSVTTEAAAEGSRSQEIGALLLDRLEADERLLVTWMGEHVPMRDIAEWLGVSHAAARQRATRLRLKLRSILEQLTGDRGGDG